MSLRRALPLFIIGLMLLAATGGAGAQGEGPTAPTGGGPGPGFT